MTWWTTVIAELCELKAAGYAFDGVWKRVLKEHPPSRRDLGLRGSQGSLDDERVFREALEWYRGIASDAWEGRRPGLAHFEPTLTLVA